MDTLDKFLESNKLEKSQVRGVVENTLTHADDGELYLQYGETEKIIWSDGAVQQADYDVYQGFGLRYVKRDLVGYAHSSTIDKDTLLSASTTVKSIEDGGESFERKLMESSLNNFYGKENYIDQMTFEDKVKLLGEMDKYARSLDSQVINVKAMIMVDWEAVHIMLMDKDLTDIRPLYVAYIYVTVERDGRTEMGNHGWGGRMDFLEGMSEERWKEGIKSALAMARINLLSIPSTAGDMPVVLGGGWGGVLLHEAVGHGLEGDFNRKGTSVFSGRIGEQVASKGVTVIDDGTIQGRRGSLNFDDEGTPTEKTVLIEDGILKGYMQDRQNARLMGMESTGNCRRQSYAYLPMPRMTTTYMDNGNHTREEIIASVDKGLFVQTIGGGQVDITSGDFVFSCNEAYNIENGKITNPVKGATLIGCGIKSMNQVSMVGNDLEFDKGIGNCGKEGQTLPVGVGQPTIKMDKLTVGGTEN